MRKKWLKSQVSRAFLPKYFPSYEKYLWIDCDAWVQEWSAIELYFKACEDGLVQCWDGTCDTEARCEEKRKEWGTDMRDHFGEILPGFEMDIMNWPESATND